jgi:uncharacterized protein DUF3485
MGRYLPIAVGVALLVGLTIINGMMTDRLAGANFTAEEKAKLLENVPKVVGDWRGEDKKVEEAIKDTAGAVGAVSRTYRNTRTGEIVDLWLIVGHGRAISAHTPDICYRASGFTARADDNSVYPLVMEGRDKPVQFLTNTFFREDVKGRRLIRVFWTWHNTETAGNKDVTFWEAPTNSRWHFGNTRALYKMYFTAEMRDQAETAEQSPCLRFARDFLPEVENALTEVHGGTAPVAAAGETGAEKTETPPAAEATAETPTETPADGAAAVETPLSDALESAVPTTEIPAASDASGAESPPVAPNTP